MYDGFKTGRTEKNPAEGWYNGELWFFDNYVVPLAKKLKECQVFGASGHEYLDTAYENRIEWEQKGRLIVEGWKKEMDSRHNGSSAFGFNKESAASWSTTESESRDESEEFITLVEC